MTDKLPTIQIKGKEYVMVKDRVMAFNENFPEGSIITEILSPIDSKVIVVRATVYPESSNQFRKYVGHSQAVIGQGMINTTAALENAETSAVGRALAMMGIGVIESMASAEEITKATKGATRHEVEPDEDFLNQMDQESSEPKTSVCATCGAKATLKSGDTNGKHWTGLFCSTGDRTHTKWG